MLITGMLAMAIAWNRRMTEEVLLRMKTARADAAQTDAAARQRAAHRTTRTGGSPAEMEAIEHAA